MADKKMTVASVQGKDLSKDFRADRLDVAGLAQAGGHLHGSDALKKFPRLLQEVSGDADLLGASTLVEWQAQGDQAESAEGTAGTPQVWLHLQAHAQVPQVCQRCLADVDLSLEVDRSYRFVADEATAEAQDDESDEDVLALSREFNLLELIEDELLMALPLVPRHEVCPVAPKMTVADAEFEAQNGEKPNPFAVLQSLKSKK